ncbi:hypothetical protein [Natronomonas salsuginis]|jgi:hypothetical protein|uniref:DUF2064 domain-containing protein n=1 Tax=Natronomonas salsuginis TaxID=2217661 RepID=A0A4V5ZPF4_9EURY|nr:hypothetical protein [Natronomonas salsuginis]TKR27583.1 hypothetical protein DM868_00340 [Natronomonas salsuginis]
MTTVAVLADPPHPDVALPDLVASSPLSGSEAADLYTALLRDTVLAVDRSGGELLVNYRPADALGLDVDSEAQIRSALDGVVDADSPRFEVQVGETFAGRAGNTATHLLETEGVGSVGVVRPEAALLARTDIDGAAMKLRSSPVVLGPAPGGRVTYAAFAEPIDYADCYAPPALETLTDRALDRGFDVDFLDTKPFLRTATDLAEILVRVRTRSKAEAIVPPHLASWVADSDLAVTAHADGSLTLRR